MVSLSDIVEQAMCIGCGLCQGISRGHGVMLEKSANGFLVPRVTGNVSLQDNAIILDCCPSCTLNTLPIEARDEQTRLDPIWGYYRRIVHGYAADDSTRFLGASGGVLSALAIYLLESEQIDFILHARASDIEPTFGEACLSFNREQVLQAAGSRYGPTAILVDIREVLDRGQRFAVIGKPCDISALRNYAHHNPAVGRQVRFWLTLVCGGFMPPAGTTQFLRDHSIDPGQVTKMRYRGHGFPGPTHIETTGGDQFDFTYQDFWGADYKRFTLPHRCKICPDSVGEMADIVAADPWPGGGPDPNNLEAPGNNVILCRTSVGEGLLKRAAADGALVLGAEGSPRLLNDYQPHQVARKYTAWPRLLGLKAEGRWVPKTAGLRIQSLAESMDRQFQTDQQDGMQKRVRQGKASDALVSDD